MTPCHGPSFGRAPAAAVDAGRQRILQHLPNRLAHQPKLPRYHPLAPAFYQHGTTYPRIQFHRVHASGIPQKTRLLRATNLVHHLNKVGLSLKADLAGGLLLPRHKPTLNRRLVVYFYADMCS